MTEEAAAIPRVKGVHIGAPACFVLELAMKQVREAFPSSDGEFVGLYIVGSALQRPDWRDVDVRMIMSDAMFEREFPGTVKGTWEWHPRWLLLTVAISDFLSKHTGLPIDFQFQPQTHANERHKGPRNAVGLGFIRDTPE